MDISRTTSGAIKVTNTSGSIFYITNPQNVVLKKYDVGVTAVVDSKVYTFPIAGLTINNVAAGNVNAALDSIATTVFTKV